MFLRALETCGGGPPKADVRWGRARTPLTFRAAGGTDSPSVDEPAAPDEIIAFAGAFRDLKTPWKPAASQVVLDLPGDGLSIPDLIFTRGRDKGYFEVLGFWILEAVFRRADLVD